MIALFFDTETTGFPREDFTPEIVQVAAIVEDTETRRVLHEVSLIINPYTYIPEDVVAVHGIDTDLARTYGVSPADANILFANLLGMADVLVGHNIIDFDIPLMKSNWPNIANLIDDLKWYDTMLESRLIINLPPGRYHGNYTDGPKPPKLTEAYRYFMGHDYIGAHDALADVKACQHVYYGIQEHKK